MIDDILLIHPSGVWWQSDQSEPNAVIAKEIAWFADVAFRDKVWYSPETVCGSVTVVSEMNWDSWRASDVPVGLG